jgi:hypothetical protein
MGGGRQRIVGISHPEKPRNEYANPLTLFQNIDFQLFRNLPRKKCHRKFISKCTVTLRIFAFCLPKLLKKEPLFSALTFLNKKVTFILKPALSHHVMA